MNVAVLCLSEQRSIHTWLGSLKQVLTIVFYHLLPDDLRVFTPSEELLDVQAVILMHPVDTGGRLSITDVKEARYDKLLKTLQEQYREHGML